MNKSNERPLWIKELFALALALVLLAPICFFLTSEGIKYAQRRDEEHLSIRTKMFQDIAGNESRVNASAEEWYDRNLSANIWLMTDSLKAFVVDGDYAGPRLFDDGFVLTFEGERPVFPAGMPEVDAQISRKLAEQSVASGAMRTGRLTKQARADRPPSPLDVTDGQRVSGPVSCLLSFGQIADGLYYVGITDEAEYRDYMARYESIDYDALEKADRIFKGNTMLVSDQDGHLQLLSAYGDIEKYQSLSEMGISEEQLRQEQDVLKINGVSYSCVYSHLESDGPETANVTMIQMLPIVTMGMRSLNRALAICHTMALSFVTMLVYMFAVRRCVRETVLTVGQARRYSPRKLRVRMICAAVTGAFAVFVVASILQGIGQIYVEAKYGQDTLDTVVRQMELSTSAVDVGDDRRQEEWYVYHGRHMASLLKAHDGFATKERLQSWCDILNIDFIMLFDAEGNETLCNRDYSGFTLNKGLGSDTSDFRRLLLGIPSIIHGASTDTTMGLERQMIGVTLPLANGAHGALIMALLPGQIRDIGGTTDINGQLAAMTTEGAKCFVVDESRNEVVYTSDQGLDGAKILERGLSEKSLRDGYMDFGTLDDESSFILTGRSGNNIFYYTVKCEALFRSVMKFGGMAAALYLMGAAALLLLAFRGYTQQRYERVAAVADAENGTPYRWDSEALEAEDDDEQSRTVRALTYKISQSAEQRLKDRARDGRTRELLQRLGKRVRWDEKEPDKKAGMVFHVGLILLLIAWGNLIVRTDLTSKGYGSMASFLFHGDWVKGVNLFSVCSVLLLVGLAYLINVISGLVFKLLSTFLLGKGKTVCKLALSAIKYLSLFVTVYFSLLYLGFPIGTVVGSIGIVSLALSLGARDMAADVLAGLSIVFEKSFEVGDIVQIGSAKGTVQEIGVRSTKLLTMDNNIMTISNHSIDSIVNLTRKLSWCTLEVKVPVDAPLGEIEAMLNRELPEIGHRCGMIVGELRYCGVQSFGSGNSYRAPGITLLITAPCNEKDLYDVNLFVNREVLLLFGREGIKVI